jgi:hypothetical protein
MVRKIPERPQRFVLELCEDAPCVWVSYSGQTA